MHFLQLRSVFIFGLHFGPSWGAPGKSSFAPLKKKNFGIVEKCCCRKCRSNLFRPFPNYAFLWLSRGALLKGLFSSCIVLQFQIFSILEPSGELFCSVRQVVFFVTPGCCGSCRSNISRPFRNFTFLRLFRAALFKGLFSSCIFLQFQKILDFGTPPGELFCSVREPLKKRNFGIVEKCCCGNCRSNIILPFPNLAFLRPSR